MEHWFFTPKYLLENHSSPTYLIQTSFFLQNPFSPSKIFFSLTNFFPFRNQPWVALKACKKAFFQLGNSCKDICLEIAKKLHQDIHIPKIA